MKALVALGALGALLIPTVSLAAQACPDRTPRAITSVAEDSVKCQKTIAKELSKYAKTQFKELSKCRLKEPTGSCPTSKNVEKTEKAAVKTQEKISKACALDAVQAGLTSSYGGETDDTIIASCALSQHNVDVEVMVGIFTGMATEDAFQDDNVKQRAKCVKDLSKLGQKYVLGQLKNVSKCIDKAMKDQVGGNLSTLCVGEYSGGTFTPPADEKAADGIAKLNDKTEEKIAKSCDLGSKTPFPAFGFIQTIFACPGANTVADLQECVVCNGWSGVLDLVEAEYAENHDVVVSPGADAIQTAVDAASPGDKIFIRSGTYAEDVTVPVGKDDVSLIGCGGATNERPFLPVSQGGANGMTAASVDGLTFQSLRFEGWDDNAIFVSTANGVSFRDIVDNGMEETRYAVFPVLSTNILIEACKVERENDAPIYVGQSNGMVVRYNDIRRGVSAIEFENSINGVATNNYATENTGGILVFKDPNLIDQSGNHQVLSNIFEANNTENFGSGTVAIVPRGTGVLIVSNDDSLFQGNILRNHDSFGLALIDQDAANVLVDPDPFPVQSGDEDSYNNLIRRNHVSGNGGNSAAPVAANLALAISNTNGGDHENCFELNGVSVAPLLGSNDCD